MTQTTEKPPELSIPAALQAGFELTTKKLWLLIFPLLLDGFLWLGPRISIQPILARLSQFLQETAQPAGTTNTQTLELLDQYGEVYNVFVHLSPPLIGVPILLNGNELDVSPIGPAIFALDNGLVLFALFVLLTFLGLLYSTLFFDLLVLSVQGHAEQGWLFLKRLPLNYLQMLGFALALLAIGLLIFIPILMVSGVGLLISPIIGQLTFAIAFFILIGGMIYLLFTLHGIFFARQPIWRALYDSFRIVRANMHTSIWLILLIMGLTVLLDTIWRALEQGSWFTVVPIFAHAFVQTSLLLATIFVYADRASRLPVSDRPILT